MKTKRTTKTKKPSIPPPPAGWEIVSKDDPRLDYLPVGALFSSKRSPKWGPSLLPVGLPVGEATKNNFIYALPIATQPAPEPATPMIRLRLSSEKPTKEDADKDGLIVAYYSTAICFAAHSWDTPFEKEVIAWLPGRLPDDILPKPPAQEQLWRKEFEEWAANGNFDLGKGAGKEAAWEGFLAAKKGGQQP